MDKVDITLRRACATCKTEEPLRFLGRGLTTIGEHSTIDVRIDPDEFSLCPTCGNPLRLHIQAYPYELVNHLDTPVAQAMYDQWRRQERQAHTIETRKIDDGQFEATVQETGATVTAATEHDALVEAVRAIHLSMIAREGRAEKS